MPVTILYPVNQPGNTYINWLDESLVSNSTIYRSIDEGILSPNDSDYVQNSGSFGATNYQFYTETGPCLVSPLNDVRVRVRFLASSVPLVKFNILFRDAFQDIIASGFFAASSVLNFSTVDVPCGVIQPTDNFTNTFTQLDFFGMSGTTVVNITPRNLKISALEVYNSGDGASSTSDSIPLYIFGGSPIDTGVPFYCSGLGFNSGFLDLYMCGIGASNFLDLYIYGFNNQSGNIPLNIFGSSPGTSGNFNTIPLFIDGLLPISGNLPLYLEAPGVSTNSGSLPLTMFGATAGTSGLFNNMPLYVAGISADGSIPLFLQGDTKVADSGFIPLYLFGRGTPIESTLPLFIYNSYVDGGIPLYTKGKGLSIDPDPDASGEGYPFAGSIPLFINRVNQVEVLPFYLHNTVTTNNLPFTVKGAYLTTSGINLVIPNITASSIKNIALYTHGY